MMIETEEEEFPEDVWIRKESRSHPNRFYYFNKITKESRWESVSTTSIEHDNSKIKRKISAVNGGKPSLKRKKRFILLLKESTNFYGFQCGKVVHRPKIV